MVLGTDCVGPHTSALCPDEGVSHEARTGELDPGVQRQRVCVFFFSFFFFLIFQGAKHLLIHTVAQPEYCHFKLHNSEKGFSPIPPPSEFTYLHTYPNNLNLFEDEVYSLFTCMNSVVSSCLTSLLHLLYILLYNGGTI